MTEVVRLLFYLNVSVVSQTLEMRCLSSQNRLFGAEHICLAFSVVNLNELGVGGLALGSRRRRR